MKTIWHMFWTRLAEKLALTIAKNQGERRQKYPQLWNCWPLWTCRWNFLGNVKANRVNLVFLMRTWLCGKLTGHEISRTEWGYGGGKFVDRNCRWCDMTIKVPKAEEEIPPALDGIAQDLGY